MSAGWDVVKTEAGYHVTFQAENNEVMLTSETYTTQQSAVEAVTTVVNLVLKAHQQSGQGGPMIPLRFRDETIP